MARLRIIHVSDLHLFVDAEGNHRPLSERALSARAMEKIGSALERVPNEAAQKWVHELFGGLDIHSDSALRAMLKTLGELLADKEYSSVVVQTGDVSTFGALGREEAARFPEWDFWQGDLIGALRREAAAWVDIFGNHDVWPGTLPLIGAPFIEGVVRTFRSRHFPTRFPSVHRIEGDGLVLELHAMNSVLSGAIDNTRAVGELVPDVLDPLGKAVPDPLADVNVNATTEGAIRLLLMHHPPHHFEKAGGGSEGGLCDATRLGEWLESRKAGARIQLILAGHRHAIDPPLPPKPDYRQSPLPAHCLQLVCSTPTQISTVDRSFSIYEFERSGDGVVVLSRKIYSRKGLADRRFLPTDGGSFHLS